MGVLARIVVYAQDEPHARRAVDRAFERLTQLEQTMSDYRATSELSRLCARAGEGPVEVSVDLHDVLARARELAERTDGAFDPTVGPLVALWREARDTGAAPEPDRVRAARALVGWRKLTLDENPRTATLADPGMRLDLGGIGKGYACDRLLEFLHWEGYDRALVEIGGDLACGAPPPGAGGWRVSAGCGASSIVIDLAFGALATSGSDEQFVEIGGRRYSHLIDPRTGAAITHDACVSVEAPDGATADALASAAAVAHWSERRALIARFPRARLWLGAP